MSQDPYQDRLRQLSSQLEQAAAENPDHPRIQELQAATRQLIERADRGERDQSDDDVRSQLTASLEMFEASHPNLTTAIMGVIDALNRIGI